MTTRQYSLRELEPALLSTGIAVRFFHHFKSPRWQRHGHDIVEMNFIVNGQGDHRLGDSVTPIGPGMLGVVHYGQTHGYRTSGAGLDLYNIYLDPQRHPLPDVGPGLRPWVPRFLPLHPELGHDRNRVVHLNFGNTEKLEKILSVMARESDERETGYREALRAGYQLFLIECARLPARQTPKPAPDLNPTEYGIEQLRIFIDRAFTKALTLADLAEQTGLAPNYLCRVFKRHTGRTIFQYVTQRRIEAAMLRLATTGDKVLAIAYESGFQDLAHFNRTFKKLSGVSPGGYRKRLRDDAD